MSEPRAMPQVQKKTYMGFSDGVGHDRIAVRTENPDGTFVTQPLTHYAKHSSEFSWSYAGSGPACTAFCILADFLQLVPLTKRAGMYGKGEIPEIACIYQDFKFDFIAPLPMGPNWEITSAQIAKWLLVHPLQTVCPNCRADFDPTLGEPCWWCLPDPNEGE